MNGRNVAIGIVGITAAFGAALWYFQTYAFYEEIGPEAVPALTGKIEPSDWQAIDALTSPLKLRACFTMPADGAETWRAGAETTEKGTPLIAPEWFECFDAGALTADLASGAAAGYLLGPSSFDGVDVHMALYPDGRAYLWRQLNEKYAEQ